MSMQLSAKDLREIANMLDKLAELPFEVEQVSVGSHTAVVRVVGSDPKTRYALVGITNGKLSGVLRDTAGPVGRGGVTQ